MNLQENISRIREMMGINEQLLPTTGMTDDTSTSETNVEPENIDARGKKLGDGIKKLFSKLKTGILKGVENVQEFLKKIKGNKKTDLIPTEVEYGQDEPPVESKTNDNNQITEKYENIIPIILNLLNGNSNKIIKTINNVIPTFVIPKVNNLLKANVNKGYGNSFMAGVCPVCYKVWWNVNVNVSLESFNVTKISTIEMYAKNSNIVKFTIFGDLKISSKFNVWEDNWINNKSSCNISVIVYIDPIERNIQICTPNVKVFSNSIDLSLFYVKINDNKLNVYNSVGDWTWDLKIQNHVNNSFTEKPKVISLSQVSPELDNILKSALNLI
jgi:hypothetical protein